MFFPLETIDVDDMFRIELDDLARIEYFMEAEIRQVFERIFSTLDRCEHQSATSAAGVELEHLSAHSSIEGDDLAFSNRAEHVEEEHHFALTVM